MISPRALVPVIGIVVNCAAAEALLDTTPALATEAVINVVIIIIAMRVRFILLSPLTYNPRSWRPEQPGLA
jgi:hypothetical protein